MKPKKERLKMSVKKHRIELSDKVKDPVTGFTGVATVRSEYLQGCARIGVQPRAKDGKMRDTQYFDEPQLIKIGRIKLPNPPDVASQLTGGYQESPEEKSAPE